MRAAAREGVLEAIATLQAGGGQQQPAAQEPQGPQTVASNAFTVREANRQGNAGRQDHHLRIQRLPMTVL